MIVRSSEQRLPKMQLRKINTNVWALSKPEPNSAKNSLGEHSILDRLSSKVLAASIKHHKKNFQDDTDNILSLQDENDKDKKQLPSLNSDFKSESREILDRLVHIRQRLVPQSKKVKLDGDDPFANIFMGNQDDNRPSKNENPNDNRADSQQNHVM